MNLLAKFRPGVLGLLLAAIALSTFATSIYKGVPRSTATEQGNVRKSRAEVPAPVEEATEEAAEEAADTGPKPTFYHYAIDVELQNLATLIKAEARHRLEEGVTVEQVNGALHALSKQPATPENTARKLYLLRTLQTLKDGEGLPQVEAIKEPTIEDYRDEIAAD